MKPASIVAAWAAALPLWAANESMPAAQQTALVQKYCAVCHHDAFKNGGLSLQHFDAAQPDPGVAAMLASKLKAQAIGAAGIAPPDKGTHLEWFLVCLDPVFIAELAWEKCDWYSLRWVSEEFHKAQKTG